jgi:sec-independent protein translocase protein TatA
MFGNFGTMEVLVIVVIILLLFGAKKIPELAKGIGKGMKEFKKALNDVEDEIKSTDDKKENKE